MSTTTMANEVMNSVQPIMEPMMLSGKTYLGNVLATTCLVLLTGCNVPGFKASGTKTATSPTGSSPVDLVVESRNGNIIVQCDPELTEAQVVATVVCRGTTQAEADMRLEKTELTISDTPDKQLKVTVQFPDLRSNGEGATITVRIPALDSVNAATSNGSVSVDGAKAAVNGNVVVDTSNGSIRIHRVSGNVVAKTSNSNLFIEDIGGKVDGHSSNGKAEIVLLDGQQGPLQIKTSNASISLTVAKDFNGSVKADTSNASVALDDPNKVAAKSSLSKSEGEIVFGKAEGSSELKTSNGSIAIKVSP